MWDTLVNQSSGGRVLGQSLELHSVNPSKTPFFDSLSSYSTGYGGDPIDVTRLKISKGRLYDFSGSFRRNREYFDYNLLANSLLTNYTAATPVLVPQPDSLHAFNTVRRNMDTNLTLMPLSRVSYRIAFNHNTNEGPTIPPSITQVTCRFLTGFATGAIPMPPAWMRIWLSEPPSATTSSSSSTKATRASVCPG